MRYAIALQRILFFYPSAAIQLVEEAGTAKDVYEHRHELESLAPEVTEHLRRMVDADWSPLLDWADRELEWCRQKGIRPLLYGTEDYPQRLMDCVDAPLVLYYRGTADLNSTRIVSIVGTRHASPYGQDMTRQLCRDLKKLCPDLMTVSGLAYGIDVTAHRESLACGIDTVGVLAHGLHKIYPQAHRQTAIEMLGHGGLLTEYTSDIDGDKMNFVRRNRIVAGMSDCTVVVESAAKGGSLITARIAFDYGHDVFAYPGRAGDEFSAGCNNLIHDNKAALITSAEDLAKQMLWYDDALLAKARRDGIAQELFPTLSKDEQRIVELLKKNGDMPASMLAIQLNTPIHQLSTLLFQMEMKGLVKAYAGGVYHLVMAAKRI